MPYKHILLIDDDEDDQEIFLAAMEGIHSSVSCSIMSNAKEALQKLIEKKLEPDLIFLDLNMPIMSGQQFLSEIKKHQGIKEIPIFILSTSSHIATIEATKLMGAKNFITKPNSFDELKAILKKIIEG